MKLIAYYISDLMNDNHISISTMRYILIQNREKICPNYIKSKGYS